MPRFLAMLFTALLLLQILGPEVVVVSFRLNQPALAARYCVNKARPQLRCNGRCHLARQLRQAEGGTSKAPAPGWAKGKYEVLPTVALVLPARRASLRPARRFAPARMARCVAPPGPGVFRPPLPTS